MLQHVASLQRENIRKPLVTIEDAAVAVKDENGQVRIRQTLENALKTRVVAKERATRMPAEVRARAFGHAPSRRLPGVRSA
ncbi:MAG: hypothetical protein K0A98_00010 [Trueperaceae bacterium]|nr:hypothetical protein [Trueperaceae bacterium]